VLYQGVYRTDFYDFAGSSEITQATVIVGPSNAYNGSCSVQYSPSTQQLSLLNNSAAVAGSGVIGQPGNGSDVILAGSQCLLDVTASSATSVGNTLSLFLSLQFPTAGSYGWYGQAKALPAAYSVTGPISASLGSLSVTGTSAPLQGRGLPSAQPSYYALNNDTPETWTYCLYYPGTTQCIIEGESAQSVSNCQATGAGLIHITPTWPSSYPPAFPSYFDLTFTADPSAVPGSRSITCSTDSGPITISPVTQGGQTYNPLTVYDATPAFAQPEFRS